MVVTGGSKAGGDKEKPVLQMPLVFVKGCRVVFPDLSLQSAELMGGGMGSWEGPAN